MKLSEEAKNSLFLRMFTANFVDALGEVFKRQPSKDNLIVFELCVPLKERMGFKAQLLNVDLLGISLDFKKVQSFCILSDEVDLVFAFSVPPAADQRKTT